jgi:hypothetical protein
MTNRGWRLRNWALATGVALALASPVAAAPSQKAPPRHPDASAGYSYTQAGEASLNGWQLTASFPFSGSLRAVVDLSGHYGSFGGADLSQLGFFVGPRWVFKGERLVPFAQGLLGGERRTASAAGVSAGDTDWGVALGGGLDYRLRRSWAVRAQAEVLLLHGDGVWDTDPRLSLSAVYRFGSR